MPATDPSTLVLIEDNPADVLLFQEALRLHGESFRLLTFSRGEAFLAHLRNGREPAALPPALIVIDLHLPGISGGEVLQEVRAEPALERVPVAIISGAPPERVAALGLRGVDAFIHKSIHVHEYVAAVARVVRELGHDHPPSRAR